MRTTRTQVDAAFKRLADAMGKTVGHWERDETRSNGYRAIIGGWALDHNIGGFVVEEISNDGGGVRQPFGSQRRKATEMFDTLCFACSVVGEMKTKNGNPKKG